MPFRPASVRRSFSLVIGSCSLVLFAISALRFAPALDPVLARSETAFHFPALTGQAALERPGRHRKVAAR